MKAQYVGDIGDFGKILLLKYLAASEFKIGVNWMLTANDQKADGKHRAYAAYSGRDCLCCCDEEVFESTLPLARKERNERKISDLEDIVSQFCEGATFFSELYSGRASRALRDDEAFEKLHAVGRSELIFFDADNGIEIKTGSSEKHVYMPEMKRYWERGQSLLIYHHLSRTGPHEEQVAKLVQLLEKEMSNGRVYGYRLCRGTARAYFMVIRPEHTKKLPRDKSIPSIAALQVPKSKWRRHRKGCAKVHGS